MRFLRRHDSDQDLLAAKALRCRNLIALSRGPEFRLWSFGGVGRCRFEQCGRK
jgi:hypothetical protein